MTDINIKVIDREGLTHHVQVPTDMGLNLMEAIRIHELVPEGTIGVCGGMAMCASCLCHIISENSLPEISDDEEAMLSEVFNTKNNSRLSCQIYINDELNNLEIELAEES